MRYSGSCHCGAVRFAVDADISEVYTCDLLALPQTRRGDSVSPWFRIALSAPEWL